MGSVNGEFEDSNFERRTTKSWVTILIHHGDEEHGYPAPSDIGRVKNNVPSTPIIEREPIIEAQPNRQDSIPIEKFDPTSTAVAQILEIIPNVESAHLLQLIETHLPNYSVFHGNRDPGHDGADGAGEREATVEEQVHDYDSASQWIWTSYVPHRWQFRAQTTSAIFRQNLTCYQNEDPKSTKLAPVAAG
jgi:hypothetical protein